MQNEIESLLISISVDKYAKLVEYYTTQGIDLKSILSSKSVSEDTVLYFRMLYMAICTPHLTLIEEEVMKEIQYPDKNLLFLNDNYLTRVIKRMTELSTNIGPYNELVKLYKLFKPFCKNEKKYLHEIQRVVNTRKTRRLDFQISKNKSQIFTREEGAGEGGGGGVLSVDSKPCLNKPARIFTQLLKEW